MLSGDFKRINYNGKENVYFHNGWEKSNEGGYHFFFASFKFHHHFIKILLLKIKKGLLKATLFWWNSILLFHSVMA